jgi:hypothetical protein
VPVGRSGMSFVRKVRGSPSRLHREGEREKSQVGEVMVGTSERSVSR